MSTIEGNDAAARLEEVERLRRRTRAALHSFWYPLLFFGALTLASTPVCELGPDWALGLYWAVAAPVGFVAVSRRYMKREAGLGVTKAALPYVATGVFIMVAAWASGAAGGILESDVLAIAGPNLAVAAGYFVFAWLERSGVLALLASGLAALAVALAVGDVGHACAILAATLRTVSLATGLALRTRERISA